MTTLTNVTSTGTPNAAAVAEFLAAVRRFLVARECGREKSSYSNNTPDTAGVFFLKGDSDDDTPTSE